MLPKWHSAAGLTARQWDRLSASSGAGGAERASVPDAESPRAGPAVIARRGLQRSQISAHRPASHVDSQRNLGREPQAIGRAAGVAQDGSLFGYTARR
jgi:hypothetical protein